MSRITDFQAYFKLECLRTLNDRSVLKLATRPVKTKILVLMINPQGRKFTEVIPASFVESDLWKEKARHVARLMIAQVYPRYCGKVPLPERGALHPPKDRAIGGT